VEEIDPRFKDTIFRVEANSYEHLCLWNEWKERIKWEDDNLGIWYQIGEINNLPICISMRWTKINNYLILFYHPTSRIVDHDQIEDWFKKHCYPKWDKDTRIAHCDAMNFHHCIHAIKAKEKE